MKANPIQTGQFHSRPTNAAHTKAQMKKLYPGMRYSGKTIRDKDGNVMRYTGMYLD